MVSTRSKSSATAPTAPAPPIVKKRVAKPAKASKPAAAPTELKALPERKLLSDAGAHVTTESFVTDATPGLIVFTYPRANTPGCTNQATGLSALKEEALAAGYTIVGASYDSAKSQAGWKTKRDIQLDLLCDTLDVGLLKALGAHKAPKGVKRSVFVFRRGGMDGHADGVPAVLVRYNISPKDCVQLIGEYIKENPCIKSEESNDKGTAEESKKEVVMDKEPERDPDAAKDA